ncbi:MAG: F-box protein [Nitrosomonas sp.]|nr:F-box protein [Nitrosomonas sp.]
MRKATVQEKLKKFATETAEVEGIFKRMCNEIMHGNRAAVLAHLLEVYKIKMQSYITPRTDLDASHYSLSVTPERCIQLEHNMSEVVIYAYAGPGRGFDSNMHCYYDKKGHVQTRLYSFWKDQGLQRLLVTPCPDDDAAVFVVFNQPDWSMLHGDILRHVATFLPCKDLLNATLVCKEWRRVLQHDSVWMQRVFHLQPVQNTPFLFEQFVQSLALLPDTDFDTIEACFVKNMKNGTVLLSNIAEAWRHQNRKFLEECQILDECSITTYPNVFAPAPQGQEEEREYEENAGTTKRFAILREVDEARKKIKESGKLTKRFPTIRNFIDQTVMQHVTWPNRAKVSQVTVFMAGLLTLQDEHGAVVWITDDGQLRIACRKNALAYKTGGNLKNTLHNMMYEYADSLYFLK